MLKTLTRVVALVALTTAPAIGAGHPPSREALRRTAVALAEAGQTRPAATVADFAGTWTIEVMSHFTLWGWTT